MKKYFYCVSLSYIWSLSGIYRCILDTYELGLPVNEWLLGDLLVGSMVGSIAWLNYLVSLL